MRILIVLPPLPPASGNQVTAHRYRQGLEARGHVVRLVTASPTQPIDLRRKMATFRPDLVHLLHAYQTGCPWLAIASPVPFVVTLTGTDIHRGIDSPAEGPVIHQVFAKASAVITQNPLTASELTRRFPGLGPRLKYLPPGIILGDTPYPLRRLHSIPTGLLLLHPAGIRPVKGNLELLDLLAPLAAAKHLFTVAFCGPSLEETYSQQFFLALQGSHWARYLGIIPPAAMPAALREADVILNNSASEGMPNVLLEAAAIGRPILARHNLGNAAVVDHGQNGLLYDDARSFRAHAERLLIDPEFRSGLSRPQRERFLPENETAVLEEIYRWVLAN